MASGRVSVTGYVISRRAFGSPRILMRDVRLFFVFGAVKNGVQQSICSWRSTLAALYPKILDEYI